VLEAESRITVAEIYLCLSIANHRANEAEISTDKKMYTKFIDGELVLTFKEDEWWLKPPYAATYLENYENCRANEKEEN
jgi:hypothetical protein